MNVHYLYSILTISLIPKSSGLRCHNCLYDEEDWQTHSCLTNPETTEICPPSNGFERCETLSGVKVVDNPSSRVLVLIRKCSQNLFGFDCEEGYPQIYELKTNDGLSRHVNLTSVKICFCHRDYCNRGSQRPWVKQIINPSLLDPDSAVCHKCVSWLPPIDPFSANAREEEDDRKPLVNCPSVICNNNNNRVSKCSIVSGTSVDNGSTVVIRKCDGFVGSGGCTFFSGPRDHYDGDGNLFQLIDALHCTCDSQDNCNYRLKGGGHSEFLAKSPPLLLHLLSLILCRFYL